MGCACEKEQEDPSLPRALSSLKPTEAADLTEPINLPIVLKGIPSIQQLPVPFESLYSVLSTKPLSTGERLLTVLPANLQKQCIVRAIPKDLLLSYESELPAILREMRLIGSIDHPNVLVVLEIVEDADFLYMVLEDHVIGEFERYFRRRERMPERLAGKVMAQVFSALCYFHQLGIVQRRLTISSLCAQTETTDQSLMVKVSLGEGQLVALDSRTQLLEECRWLAPEALAGKYTEKSDIWSCGVLLYYLLTGEFPFPGDSPEEITAKITKGCLNFSGVHWRKVSHDAISFVSRLLHPLPASRPSAQACQRHPWAVLHAGKAKLKSRTVGRRLWRLEQAAAPIGLRRAIERYMVERMGDREELATIAEAFRALDADGDGTISLKELYKGYRQSMNKAKARETAENVYKTIDFNNSGAINYSEFLLATVNTEKLLCSANLRSVFDSFDKDKSGQISAAELRELLMVDGAEQMEALWQELISMTDTSGDGELDFDEFEALMTRVMVN